ncbi:MAG: hypothetical protein GY868_08050 [Deltaproteobacteria bacterium]|nr:hypothetical protein [Deltaproteobacteria bacterium]
MNTEEILFSFSLNLPDRVPPYRLSACIRCGGRLDVQESNKTHPARQLSQKENKFFFAALADLGIAAWPPNCDCGVMDDSSWSLCIEHGRLHKKCFGVPGFEPEGWDALMLLIEQTIKATIPQP